MRRKILKISGALFVELFGKGPKQVYQVIKDPVPSDARIIDVRFNGFGYPDLIEILLESESFDRVPAGESYPELRPVIQSFHIEGEQTI